MKVGFCVVTLNAGAAAHGLIESLAASSLQPDRKLVIDSGSSDGTAELFALSGFELRSISVDEFDHAGTRQLAVELMSDCDVLIFATQDVVLVGSGAIGSLLAAFDEPEVALAYGRQLPAADATAIAAHARAFNYPPVSSLRSVDDIERLGVKAAFCSNSFAAYRRDRLLAVGGFPERSIFGEDTLVAARMLLEGDKIAYRADAVIVHSHNYSLGQEFRRYFDIGVMHRRESWFRRALGAAEGEGRRFVVSEMKSLAVNAPLLIPEALLRSGLKLAAYRLGLLEQYLPVSIKRRLSMNRTYWCRDQEGV